MNATLSRQVVAPRPLVEGLSESETHFHTILASEPACVKLIGREGDIQSMNPTGLAIIVQLAATPPAS